MIGRKNLDLIGAFEDVIESSSDDNVFVEGICRDESGIGFNAEGESFGWRPNVDDFEEANFAFEGGDSFASDSFVIEGGSTRSRKS